MPPCSTETTTASRPAIDDPASDHGDLASALGNAAGFLLRTAFFLLAPVLFGVTCVMVNQPFLLVLLIVIAGLTAFAASPTSIVTNFPWLEKLPLLGSALKTLNQLNDYYRDNRARSLLFYLFYPITCPVFAIFSSSVRKEFRLYLGIITAILTALLIEGIVSYSAVYPPYLTVTDAAVWIIVRFLFSIALVLCFLVPVATTSFSYKQAGWTWRLRTLSCIGLVSTVFAVAFCYLSFRTNISLLSSEHLLLRIKNPAFRAELREATEMFLSYHARRTALSSDDTLSPQVELTKKFQVLVGKLAVRDEAKGFNVFTVPDEKDPARACWLCVRLRFNDAAVHAPTLIAALDPQGIFHSTWQSLPDSVKVRFQVSDSKALAARKFDPPLEQIGAATLIDDLP